MGWLDDWGLNVFRSDVVDVLFCADMLINIQCDGEIEKEREKVAFILVHFAAQASSD